jgi:hypothetical protein
MKRHASKLILPVMIFFALSGCGDNSNNITNNIVIDQHFEWNPGCIGYGDYQILASQPSGQEFIPTQGNLVAVEVYLSFLNSPLDDSMTLNIRETNLVGPIVASSSKHLGPFSDSSLSQKEWVRFALPSTQLVPGATYLIELQATNVSFGWSGADNFGGNPACDYSKGTFIYQGNMIASDMFFRTYVSP